MPTQVGSPIPPFKAKAYRAERDAFEEVASDALAGQWACLVFYPAAFSPLCPTELIAFNEAAGEFDIRGCQLLACSTDSHYALRGWCQADARLTSLKFPLLADIHKRMAMDFGVLLAHEGVALRGTFLIDPEGQLRAATIYDNLVGRSVDETLRALDALQTGQPCPCNWTKGEPTMA